MAASSVAGCVGRSAGPGCSDFAGSAAGADAVARPTADAEVRSTVDVATRSTADVVSSSAADAEVRSTVDVATRSTVDVVTRSTADTIALGERIGQLLKPGDVLVLTGDLGAGKTQLTKGIAAGMGVADDVCSPTFTIGMVYEGDEMPLYHFDLYRLEDAAQLDDTGIFDVLGDDGPCVIEWGEQFSDQLGDERLDVTLRRLDDEAEVGEEPAREVTFVAHGTRAAQIVAALG